MALTMSKGRQLVTMLRQVRQHHPYTRGHLQRVALYTRAICEELHLPQQLTIRIIRAAKLHDVGKLAVSRSTLNWNKPQLPSERWSEIQMHPQAGIDRLTSVESDPVVLAGVRGHHERLSGKGYPRGVSGERVGLAARVIAVADTFDAMTSIRSYSKAMEPGLAREKIRGMCGHLAPEVVNAFLAAEHRPAYQHALRLRRWIPS